MLTEQPCAALQLGINSNLEGGRKILELPCVNWCLVYCRIRAQNEAREYKPRIKPKLEHEAFFGRTWRSRAKTDAPFCATRARL